MPPTKAELQEDNDALTEKLAAIRDDIDEILGDDSEDDSETDSEEEE